MTFIGPGCRYPGCFVSKVVTERENGSDTLNSAAYTFTQSLRRGAQDPSAQMLRTSACRRFFRPVAPPTSRSLRAVRPDVAATTKHHRQGSWRMQRWRRQSTARVVTQMPWPRWMFCLPTSTGKRRARDRKSFFLRRGGEAARSEVTAFAAMPLGKKQKDQNASVFGANAQPLLLPNGEGDEGAPRQGVPGALEGPSRRKHQLPLPRGGQG